ncbi:MAG TPA: hypothetical protein VMI55_07920 [Thermoplasmata archaeon]|nr:hypothetical protein [Thermoplasmata archaeon]
MERKSSAKNDERDTRVLDWLLEPDQPAVRYHALINLLGRRLDDPEVKAARSRIARVGWAADQLRQQGPEGFWERRGPKNVSEYVDFLYFPPYLSTNWRALVLAEFGLDSTTPQVRKVADLMFQYKLRTSSPFNFYHEEVCISANCARMLTRFGYGDDRRVRRLYDWLIEDQREDGGWNCSPDTPGTLDAWEALAAFATVPKRSRSPQMDRAVERGAEFYLARNLFKEGKRYDPWFRLHYPNHYLYDILVGLDVLTQLGYGGDRRLGPALDLLRKKRQGNGTWRLDRQHPDLGPGLKIYSDMSKVRPLVIEPAGRPSKWITLKALTVLKRVEAAE